MTRPTTHHRTAGDIQAGNVFGMAGNMFRVDEIYDTVDDEFIRIRFYQIGNDPEPKSCIALFPRDLFFVITA